MFNLCPLSHSCFIPWSNFQIFSKPYMDSSLNLLFLKSMRSTAWLFHTLLDFVGHCHILPQISLFQILIYLMVFYTGIFAYHPHCLLPWAFSSCFTSWKAWCHGMMQCFIFTILHLLFSDVFSSFVLVIPNQIWLLAAAELWVNILTNIFRVTMRSLRSNNKFRHSFLCLCLDFFYPT